jgi:hypothetical protein
MKTITIDQTKSLGPQLLAAFPPESIKTHSDVERFFKAILDGGLVFHPDTSFMDYIALNPDGSARVPQRRTFKIDEAHELDILMAACFDIAGDAVYEIGMDLMTKEVA